MLISRISVRSSCSSGRAMIWATVRVPGGPGISLGEDGDEPGDRPRQTTVKVMPPTARPSAKTSRYLAARGTGFRPSAGFAWEEPSPRLFPARPILASKAEVRAQDHYQILPLPCQQEKERSFPMRGQVRGLAKGSTSWEESGGEHPAIHGSAGSRRRPGKAAAQSSSEPAAPGKRTSAVACAGPGVRPD